MSVGKRGFRVPPLSVDQGEQHRLLALERQHDDRPIRACGKRQYRPARGEGRRPASPEIRAVRDSPEHVMHRVRPIATVRLVRTIPERA